MSRRNLRLNNDRCVIKTQELKYLDHITSCEGAKACPAKVAAVVNMPVPKSKEEVRRFIGVKNLATNCPNLISQSDLTKKDVAWNWDPNHHQAWLDKTELIRADIELKLFDPTKPVA